MAATQGALRAVTLPLCQWPPGGSQEACEGGPHFLTAHQLQALQASSTTWHRPEPQNQGQGSGEQGLRPRLRMDVSCQLTQPRWVHTSLTPPPKVSVLQTRGPCYMQGSPGVSHCHKLLCSPALTPTAAQARPAGRARQEDATLLPATKDSKKPAGS